MADEKELETKTEAEEVKSDEVKSEDTSDLEFDTAVKENNDADKDDEVKAESDEKEDEVKAEASEDDEVKEENAETDEVKLEAADEDEVKTESEEDKKDDEVKAEAEGDDEVKAESDEKEDEVKAEDAPAPADDYKLSEELNDLLKVELDPAIKEKIDCAFDTIVKEQIARLKEQLRDDATKEVKAEVKNLKESVKVYLEKAARKYIAENKIALQESLRLKFYESFFGKVKTLFKENYVELKESDEDSLKDLKKENDELKVKAEGLVKDNTKLAESVILLKRQNHIAKKASDMFLTESNRFKIASEKLLNESIKMTDKTFNEKLDVIAELFSKKTAPAKKKLLSEGKIQKAVVTATEKAQTKQVDPFVASIINGF